MDVVSSAVSALQALQIVYDLVKKLCNDYEQFKNAVTKKFPDDLARCKDYLDILQALKNASLSGSKTLAQFEEVSLASASVLQQWKDQLAKKGLFAVGTFFRSKARLSQIEDMTATFSSLREDLHQLVQALHLAEAQKLNELQKAALAEQQDIARLMKSGSFRQYQKITDEWARQQWMDNFPGRNQVPWGDVCMWLRWEEPLSTASPQERARAFYWLKEAMDEDRNHIIAIGEFNHFTSDGLFKKKLAGFLKKPIPNDSSNNLIGEDELYVASPTSDSKTLMGKSLAVNARIIDARKMLKPGSPLPEATHAQKFKGLDGVDLVFLLDCTSSMGSWIHLVSEQVTNISGRIEREAHGVKVRVAFVGYRDMKDSEPLVVKDFTSALAISEFARKVTPFGGGGDAAEDVFGGIEKVLQLSWSKGGNVVHKLVHIGDAPSHGTLYHDFEKRTKDPSWAEFQAKWDQHPHFDTDGEIGKRLMTQLAAKQIDYTFVEILVGKQSFTRKMTNRLSKWYNDCPSKNRLMEVLEIGLEEFGDSILSILALSAGSIIRSSY